MLELEALVDATFDMVGEDAVTLVGLVKGTAAELAGEVVSVYVIVNVSVDAGEVRV
jgi:hypothetical protein